MRFDTKEVLGLGSRGFERRPRTRDRAPKSSRAATILSCLIALGLPAAALGAEYSFAVPKLEMQTWVQPDGSVRIVYDITFRNNPGAHPIDIVDIGAPTRQYGIQRVQASMGGQTLGDVRPSTVVSPGFEVHLHGQTIPPGRSRTLHVEFPVPDMVYQDTTRADYASLQVVPTWFGSRYVTGTTELRVAIVLPPGVQPDEVLDQGKRFAQKSLVRMSPPEGGPPADRAVVAWQGDVRLVEAHKFGASFPKRVMQRVVHIGPFGLLLKWFSESTQARVTLGVVLLTLFAFLFFRFSGGTGVSVFVILSAGGALLFIVSPVGQLLSFPLLVVLIALNEWMLGRRKRGYMPPIASVEGGGIKRGLTAPEAAALLEMPLSKVLGLAVFGLLKKGALRQVQAEPLQVEVDPDFRLPEATLAAARGKFYREAAQRRGIPLYAYEYPLLRLIQDRPGKPLAEINFTAAIKQILEQTAARMSGFDLSQTRDYYRAIVARAAQQAGAIADIPQREKRIDRDFEWILLDPRYPDVFNYPRPYRPPWARTYVDVGGRGPSAPGAPASPGPTGRTTFGEVSASFAGWAENTMGGLASSISPVTLSTGASPGGLLDLSGADHVTGALFKALSEASSSGGGRSGGGCACACAGCACACACAGGGR